MKIWNMFLLMTALVWTAGCAKESNRGAQEASADEPVVQGASFKPFVIYQDHGSAGNHFFPSGFMPNGKCLKLDDNWTQNCYEGTTCLKVDYDIVCSRADQKWGGIYWLNPANNWGHFKKGGFNLQGAGKLTFWARGEKGGERIEEFKMGGISGDYPDSDSASIGPVILTKEWRQYTIDLRGKDLSFVSGGFSWSASVEFNVNGCTFYLDGIQYE